VLPPTGRLVDGSRLLVRQRRAAAEEIVSGKIEYVVVSIRDLYVPELRSSDAGALTHVVMREVEGYPGRNGTYLAAAFPSYPAALTFQEEQQGNANRWMEVFKGVEG
jgi:hypothetical protein